MRFASLLLMVALSSCATAPAFAGRHAHHHKHTHHVRPASAPVLPVFWSFLRERPQPKQRVQHRHRAAAVVQVASGSSDVVSAARAEVGKGAVYGRSNLWCARFMNWVLERSGYHGTGSDLAWSFASLPQTYMHVGAIAVMRHHVGVVSGVTASGDPIIISGNNGHRVRETVYPRSRVATFVVPR